MARFAEIPVYISIAPIDQLHLFVTAAIEGWQVVPRVAYNSDPLHSPCAFA